MAVPFDLHAAVDGDRSRVAHSPEIVSTEIHQHHVFGTLLLVGHEIVLERLVFLWVRTTATSPCKWSVGDHPIADATEDLRTRRHEDASLGLHVDLVGTRVDHPECTVDVEGVGGGHPPEALAQDDLERIPGTDVVAGSLHRLLEGG